MSRPRTLLNSGRWRRGQSGCQRSWFECYAVAAEIGTIERLFQLTADDPAIYPIWKGLVVTHLVPGIRVYDARLVAAMLMQGIDCILTLNVADFSRYGVAVLHPMAAP